MTAFLGVVSGCGDRTASQTFDLKNIIYTGDFTLGVIPPGTKVEVYPTYVIDRKSVV